MDAAGLPLEITDWLTVDDPRRAIQIPQEVVSAGYEPNPRIGENKSEIITAKCINE